MVLNRRRRAEQDDGAVAVLVAVVVATVVIPLLALVVDLGLTRTLSVRFRGAADAAALAAAALMPTAATAPASTTAAKSLVAANLATPTGGWDAAWSSCVDPNPLPDGTAPSPGNCISFDYALKQVRVTVPGQDLPSPFAGALGDATTRASATSTASWGDRISPAVGSCVLCVTGSYASGAETVRVSGGDAGAATMNVVWPGRLLVSGGGVTFASSWISQGGTILPLPVKRAPQDYFAPGLTTLQASVPYGQVANPGPAASGGACSPGIYQTIDACTSFASGAYYVTGHPSTTLSMSLRADATDVMLFFTCSRFSGSNIVAAPCPNGRPPRFNGAAGAARTLRAPGGSGFALVFDQGLSRTEFLNSGYQFTVYGDVYGPAVTLRPGGTANALVHGRVIVAGLSGNLTYPFQTMLQVDAPPVSSTGLSNGAVRLVRSG